MLTKANIAQQEASKKVLVKAKVVIIVIACRLKFQKHYFKMLFVFAYMVGKEEVAFMIILRPHI